MKSKILIVEDEAAIREMLGYTLMKEGYVCQEAADVEQARAIVLKDRPDLILLDWMLPGVSGIDFARRLRSDTDTRNIPIIMLTAKGEEDDKIRGLDTGVDDYITKPFSTKELLARLRAVMRRYSNEGQLGIIEIDGLVLDPETYRVTARDKIIEISPTEFKLLHFFITHPERVYSRSQLLDHVWGQNVYVEERTVDVHIRRLRKTLEPFGFDRLIQTVRSVGYRFSTR
ncbi:MAG: phosphate regulon transcriptional regulatory protein PhoB [Gammaproteobacteria bacterium RIFCSPLOWO2_12_47_11]|nr:MAG: phosphate regulon transcriptional regulatory protein PhoB [Gammaproteobacteria bacterium RIFCSPLOWO2_12_47_11]